MRYILFCCLLPAIALAQTSVASQPLAVIPTGDSPFALALNSANTQATAVNLFPYTPAGAAATTTVNIQVLDVVNRKLIKQFLAGTRLVAIAVTGTTALIINEDQNAVRLIDVTTATEITAITVGSRPSNVAVVSATQAVVTNGTSGDISFIDIPNRKLLGAPITVGNDPRAVAVLQPAERYAYVALGGDNKIAIIDLSQSPQKVIGSVATGKNPVSIAISADGQYAVVANLTNNTATILSLANPAAPVATTSVPVCGAPTSVAANPSAGNETFYIGCESSSYFAVVDAKAQKVTGIVEMCSDGTAANNPITCTSPTSGIPSSGIAPSSDGKFLYVLEFQNGANLRVYDLPNLKLDPIQPVDIPGEPQLNYFMDSTGTCSTSFYKSTADLAPGSKEGIYSMVITLPTGLATGGFNLGGGFQENNGIPAFGQFQTPPTSIASPQPVNVVVDAVLAPGATGNLAIQVFLYKEPNKTTPVMSATGTNHVAFTTAALDPASFYTLEVHSQNGAPRGIALIQLISPTSGFVGGTVSGGYGMQGVTGYGGYCVPASQTVNMVIQGVTSFGAAASGDLILNVYDPSNKNVRTVNNSLSASGYPPPTAPATPTAIDFYVDASAITSTGTGTKTNPFKSISKAVTTAGANKTIFVLPGTYSTSKTGEVFPIDNFQAGIQLIGSGASTTIIDMEHQIPTAASGKTPNGLIVLASNVRVSGFTIKGAGQLGLFVCGSCGNASNPPRNVIIEKNWLTFNGRSGLSSASAPGLIVQNNLLTLNSENGMVITAAGNTPPTVIPTGTCPASPSGTYGAYILNNISTDARVDGILLSQGGNVCVFGNTSVNNGSSGIEFNNRIDTTVPNQGNLNGVVAGNTLINNGGVQYPYAGTGVLSTENANIDLIQDNTMDRNHPTQISIFLNATAGTIQRNTVTNGSGYGIVVQRNSTVTEISNNTSTSNVYSGIYAENVATVTRILSNVSTGNGTGLSVLTNSKVTTVDSNSFDRNGVGAEVANTSAVAAMTNNSLTKNSLGSTTGAGLFVRAGSNVQNFTGPVQTNSGQSGIVVDSASINFTGSNTVISGNAGNGIQAQTSSTITLGTGVSVSANKGAAGIFLDSGTKATITGVKIDGNANAGVQAGGNGTTGTIAAGVSVTNTSGYGLNAQAGGTITCSTAPTYSGNTKGNVLGATTGCGTSVAPAEKKQ